jgi:hypothetical protein
MDHEIELCKKMLVYAYCVSKQTENKRASEIKKALEFFFTDKQISAAHKILTGE